MFFFKNVTLPSPHPIIHEQGDRQCANQHPNFTFRGTARHRRFKHVSSGSRRSPVYQAARKIEARHASGSVVYSRSARSFKIIRFSCIGQGIRLVLHVLNLSQELVHCRFTFFLRRKLINSQLSSSMNSKQILRNSSISWQLLHHFPGNCFS